MAVEVPVYPTLRYLCEAGLFVGRLPYPAAFRLPSFDGPRPLVGPGTRYFIGYERPHVLARTHAGFDFRSDPSSPRSLYVVVPAPDG